MGSRFSHYLPSLARAYSHVLIIVLHSESTDFLKALSHRTIDILHKLMEERQCRCAPNIHPGRRYILSLHGVRRVCYFCL